MDFWSRLVANTPLSSRTSKDAARDPIRRRQRFEKEYSQLLQLWRNASNLSQDVEAAENIEMRLQTLTNMLVDESRRPLPHPCISFCSRKQIYVYIAKIATSSYNEWVIREAVLFFATLIESEEEAFVETEPFSSSLTALMVRITGANSIRLGSDTEVRVVELAFNITTKIRLEPHILPTWFKLPNDGGHQYDKFKDERERFAGKTQREDFPLFYVLMDYIHSEGKIGDFARTGLLYIIEAASNSVQLEQWVVESDLSTLMATGLGALYSQLSRKLVVDHPPHKLPPVLAFSDYEHPETTFEIVSSCSPDFQLHLETFLSHLLFWQDVLNHCKSTEIKSTLLEHFQVIFLQQLLYPSLLESSDVDGGSSVAVLTYLRRILESLDHPDMINLILHYLLALPEGGSLVSPDAEPTVSAARKRKSMDLATMMATRDEPEYTPILFNLVDLIQSCLKSPNQQTVCVTLQLLAAILKRHHRYAIITLLNTERLGGASHRRTVGAHQQEVEFLMTLAESTGGQDNFDEMYETILKDTMTRVEGHPCSIKLVTPKISTRNHGLPPIPDTLPGAPQDVPPHTLNPHDPLLNNILDLLETFFINAVETNLSITETILDMAVCGFIGIEGWLLRHPTKYQFEEDNDESGSPPQDDAASVSSEMERLEEINRCRRRPKWQPSTLPRILCILASLSEQVRSYREAVPRFDELIQQRREAFQTADSIVPSNTGQTSSQAPNPAAEQARSDSSRSASPARPSALEGFAQRLLSELGSSPSRSNSPRGPKEASRSSRSLSTPSKPLPQKPLPSPPKEFPLNLENPSQSKFIRPASEASVRDESAALPGRTSPFRAAATFAAEDQEILSRRVGLPMPAVQKVAPIPLNLKKGAGSVSVVEEDAEVIAEANEDKESAGADDKEQPGEEQVADEQVGEQVEGEQVGREVPGERQQAEEEGPKVEEGETTQGGAEEAETVEGGAAESETAEGGTAESGIVKGETPGGEAVSGETAEVRVEVVRPSETEVPILSDTKTTSVSHLLTNAIIFQSFLLELASLVQVRAGLFNEVKFA